MACSIDPESRVNKNNTIEAAHEKLVNLHHTHYTLMSFYCVVQNLYFKNLHSFGFDFQSVNIFNWNESTIVRNFHESIKWD